MPKDAVASCPKKTNGSILATVKRTDPGLKSGRTNKPLKGVTFKLVETGDTKSSGGSGTAQFKKLASGAYKVQAELSPKLAAEFEIEPLERAVDVGGAESLAPFVANRLAPLAVVVKGTAGLKGVHVKLTGPKTLTKDTDGSGVADFGKLPLGTYKAEVSFEAGDANDLAWLPPAAAPSLAVVRGTANRHEIVLEARPSLAVTVVSLAPAKALKDVKLKVTVGGRSVEATTDENGGAKLDGLAAGENEILVELGDVLARDYEAPAQQRATLRAGQAGTLRIELAAKASAVHLKWQLKLPDDSKHILPPALPFKVRFEDGTTAAAKLDAKGLLVDDKGAPLKVARTQKFTLDLPAAANKYLVCEKAGDEASAELIEDAAVALDSPLGVAMQAGKRAILLPQADVTLKQLDLEITAADNYAETFFEFKDAAELGTAEAPIELVLKPKWQYLRLEFFDRTFGKKDHGDKRVAIPAVLVKAGRKSTDGTLPKADAASNWTMHADDAAKTVQAVPWLVTKKADGAELPKLDKDVLFEFGYPNAYVESKSKTERVLVKLDPVADKAKRAPGLGRAKYYDLPKVWKSKNQYTRLPGDKAKFFDELTEAEIEASFDAAKPLGFSLDDVVLTANDGSQAVTDQDETGSAKDLSKHSRMAVLVFDAADKYNIKVHDPRNEAVFHSKTAFVKESGAEKYRNVIADVPPAARAILFCNGMHDLFDKRTEAADFAKKQVVGARAAKLGDADVSVKKKFNTAGDVNKGYVFQRRVVDEYFLHYGGDDGTTVYAGLVTHWSARIFSKTADAPGTWDHVKYPLTDDLVDVRNYRKDGMANAMERWNGKKYEYEQQDDGAALKVKPFFLFEAKDVEDPQDTFVKVGGKETCCVYVGTDAARSWASAVQMFMRKSAYRGEGPARGSDPATEARENDYDGNTAAPRNAFAHELGHGAVGLWDDYIVQTEALVPGLPSYGKDQPYPGMPFKRDASSMMSVNQAIRLRMFWGRANWLNDEAKAGKSLHPFLDGKQFRVAYEPSGKARLKYKLEPNKVFWAPAATAPDFSLGEQGMADLHLYTLGQDEFAQILKGGPYNGIVVVEPHFSVGFIDGFKPAPPKWTTGTAYAAGRIVAEGAKFYLCTEAHTAGATFAGDAAKWVEAKPGDSVIAWAANTDAPRGQMVADTVGNKGYAALAAYKMGSRTSHHWLQVGTAKGAWAATTAYVVGDTVTEGGATYVCKTAHTAGATFAGDAAKWLTKGADKGAWAAGTAYALNETCTDGGKTWICTVAHTAGTVAADVQAGRLVEPTSWQQRWTDAKKRQWAGEFYKAIVAQLEGAEGKYKLVGSDAAKPGSKSYLRVFPQFVLKASVTDADADGTHYVVEVTLDGSDRFEPSVEFVRIGSGANNKTIVRYVLGKLSDDAGVRAGQDLTSDLAKADLDKIKEWVAAQVGGNFTVQDIT